VGSTDGAHRSERSGSARRACRVEGHVPRPGVLALRPRGPADGARLNLAYRKGDTIAIGVRGTPNGPGDLLPAKDDEPKWIRRAYELNGDDGSADGYQGLSMIVTTRAARR
jgi:hypothetical protein